MQKISDAIVDDVEKIAIEFNYPKIPIYCDQRLYDALQALDNAWDRTTKRIKSGENAAFKDLYSAKSFRYTT